MMRPTHKKRRLEEPLHLIAFPDEVLFQVLSYLPAGEIWNVSCVNTLLSEIATNFFEEKASLEDPLLAEIFQSLHHHEKKERIGADSHIVSLLRPVTLWKNLLVGRENCQRFVMTEGFDFHNVWNGGIPAFDHDLGVLPEWLEPRLSVYQFAVRLWKEGEGGILSTITATLPRKRDRWDNTIFLYLQREERWKGKEAEKARAIAQHLRSGMYYALEILVSDVTNTDNQDRWNTLYSSLHPLQPYGGGDFTEYEAMPWFRDDIEERAQSSAERWATLPFVQAKFAITDDHWSSIKLQFHWRDCQGRKHGLLGPFNRLVLLKHRCNQAYKTVAVHDNDSEKRPRCLRTPMADLENYVPKPLGDYSFRIDVQKDSNPSEKCSFFIEHPPEDKMRDETIPRLSFQIPREHHNHFPWADDYSDDTSTEVRLVKFDETISIYAIDRRTGKQAKLFQSTFGEIWDHFNFHPFGGFAKCGALSQYSFGDDDSTIPVPVIRAYIPEAWKEDFFTEESPPSTRTIDLHLEFECYSGQGQGTGRAIGGVEGLSNDMLAFLEKGLSYK